MPNTKTITIKYNGRRVRLYVNKSGVLGVPGDHDGNAVGVIHKNGAVEIDGAMLAACIPALRENAQIHNIPTLIEALRDYRGVIGNKGGSLYGVIDMAAESLELGMMGNGWLGTEMRARFTKTMTRGFYLAIAFDTKKPLSGEQYPHIAYAVKEIVSAACKSKKPGEKFAVIRVLPMSEWRFNRDGTIVQSTWVCSFAVSTLRKERTKRELARYGVGSCTVSANRRGKTHPVRVVKYRRTRK